jgi:hypothetical protein
MARRFIHGAAISMIDHTLPKRGQDPGIPLVSYPTRKPLEPSTYRKKASGRLGEAMLAQAIMRPSPNIIDELHMTSKIARPFGCDIIAKNHLLFPLLLLTSICGKLSTTL